MLLVRTPHTPALGTWCGRWGWPLYFVAFAALLACCDEGKAEQPGASDVPTADASLSSDALRLDSANDAGAEPDGKADVPSQRCSTKGCVCLTDEGCVDPFNRFDLVCHKSSGRCFDRTGRCDNIVAYCNHPESECVGPSGATTATRAPDGSALGTNSGVCSCLPTSDASDPCNVGKTAPISASCLRRAVCLPLFCLGWVGVYEGGDVSSVGACVPF